MKQVKKEDKQIALLNNLPDSLAVATSALLLDEVFTLQQWHTVRKLPISRRNLVPDIGLKLTEWGGTLYGDHHQPYPVPWDMALIFGEDAPDFRWISTYKKANKQGLPAHKSYTIERLRWLELYLCLTVPYWVQHRQQTLIKAA